MALEDRIMMAHKALMIDHVEQTSDYVAFTLSRTFRPTVNDVQLLSDIGLPVVFFANQVFVCEKGVNENE